jgi:hypothetical protein
MRFCISEWNAGDCNTGGVWSGWSSPERVQSFYAGWLHMLAGDGNLSSTRFWDANVFLLAGNSDTGSGRYYNIIRRDGSTPAWYETFKSISTSDPNR